MNRLYLIVMANSRVRSIELKINQLGQKPIDMAKLYRAKERFEDVILKLTQGEFDWLDDRDFLVAITRERIAAGEEFAGILRAAGRQAEAERIDQRIALWEDRLEKLLLTQPLYEA